MSNDKTSVYILAIVTIVALVGAVYMVSLPGNGSGDAITGNVILNEEYSSDRPSVDYSGVFRTLAGLSLIGACVFMYHKF